MNRANQIVGLDNKFFRRLSELEESLAQCEVMEPNSDDQIMKATELFYKLITVVEDMCMSAACVLKGSRQDFCASISNLEGLLSKSQQDFLHELRRQNNENKHGGAAVSGVYVGLAELVAALRASKDVLIALATTLAAGNGDVQLPADRSVDE